jgi:hypothetical protein
MISRVTVSFTTMLLCIYVFLLVHTEHSHSVEKVCLHLLYAHSELVELFITTVIRFFKFLQSKLFCRFVLSFSLGAGPVPGLLLPEIFPNRIRAKAVALCMSVHWVRVQ